MQPRFLRIFCEGKRKYEYTILDSAKENKIDSTDIYFLLYPFIISHMYRKTSKYLCSMALHNFIFYYVANVIIS